MINNHLKIAWRNLFFNKLFSTLNIFGLALGLTVAILLSLFIIQERSFDDVPHQDRIYRFLAHVKYDGLAETWAGVPNAIGPTVKDNMPEVQLAARTVLNQFGENANFSFADKAFIEKRLYWADPALLEIFDFHFIYGDKKKALTEPNTIILSATKAKQYFGDKDPINQILTYNRNQPLKVTGVYRDLPATSTFDADMIGCFASSGFGNNLTWDNASFETYILLRDKKDQPKVAAYLPKMLTANVGEKGTYYTLGMQALKDIHLYSAGITSQSGRLGNATQLRQLIYLAIALLLMAAINYMNLATARAQLRSKEVGIRKALGISKRGLIIKFYAETAMMTCIAIMIALLIAIVCIPLFNALSGKTLLYTTLLHPLFWIGLPLLWLTITAISGLYPAMVLSAYNPIAALHQVKQPRSIPVIFRHALVVLQSTASIVLIVGVIVMNIQMKYITQRKLGYSPENVIAISTNSLKNLGEYDALKTRLKAMSATQYVTLSQAFPGQGENGRSLHKDQGDKQGTMLTCNFVQEDVDKTLQLHVLAGRMVKQWQRSDTTVDGVPKFEIVLNKKAVDYLGYKPEEAIGKIVEADMGKHTTIVGVVGNFNYNTLHSPVGVYSFNNAPYSIRYMMVRFKTGDLKATLKQYEDVFKSVIPEAPFDYTFLDSRLKSLYLADQQTANVLLAFSILAICVGCLGLFGLAAFTAEKRTKEIGVRKVLGATVPSLVSLLCRDLVRLVLLAFVIACPVAYWGFGHWLDGFAYRISIQWWMFGVAGVVAIIIAIFTVSSQAIRVAMANPVNSLRRE